MRNSFGKCLNCAEEVIAPNWSCKTGEKHEVSPKTYYKDDAPSDPGARMPGTFIPIGQPLRDSKTLVCNMIPERREQRGHEVISIPGINAEFARGQYTTSDPEMQFWCDRHAERGGCVTQERWAEVYLTPQEKTAMKKAEMEAGMKRLESEYNSLLSKVQSEKKKQASA